MKIFICLLLPLLGVNGKDCSDVEDPIKRDEAAPGPWNVSRVEWKPSGLQGALVPVTLGGSHPLGKTALYEGDAYVIQYSVRKGRTPDVVYFWQGKSSSMFEKGASAILAVQVDDATGGRAKQARVAMGEEPAHFLNMMDGNFITLQGGVARKKPTVQDKDGVMLFKVESQCNSVGSKKPLVRTNQVDETVSSLNNEDAFILLDMNKKSVFTWAAQGSSAEEKSTMASVAETIVDNAFGSLSTKPRVQNLTGRSPPTEMTTKLAA